MQIIGKHKINKHKKFRLEKFKQKIYYLEIKSKTVSFLNQQSSLCVFLMNKQIQWTLAFFYLSVSLFNIPSNFLVNAIVTRCDYVCAADDACRAGNCVLTYCLDTPYCFRFCFQCQSETNCQQAGPYCYLLFPTNDSRSTLRLCSKIHIIYLFLISALFLFIKIFKN